MTLADLYKVEGQAELIDGKIVVLPTHGTMLGLIVVEIVARLQEFESAHGRGSAYLSTLGYALPRPLKNRRQSFCADASYYTGPLPENRMSFIVGAPDFAVEVRDDEDTPMAEQREAKRADYFEAGTLVVWDVDPIASYRFTDPTQPLLFPSGNIADAEPALPGWRVAVDAIFAG